MVLSRAGADVSVTDTDLDGRRRRRVDNRAAVLEAMVQLWRDGVLDARASDIAERAGLSPRSLFRYFDNVDDLVRAAIEHALGLARDRGTVAARPDEPTERKVRAVLAGRDDLFAAVGVAAHAARVTQHRSALVAERVARTRHQLRAQLARLFAPELSGAPEGTLDLVDLMTSFESWELRQGLSPRARQHTTERLAETLTDLLTKERR